MRCFRRDVPLALIAASAALSLPASGLAVAPTPSVSTPTALTLSYAAYVHGFRAMVISVGLREADEAYAVSLHDHTVGLVGALIDNHVASEATGHFDGETAEPAHYASAGHSRGADRTTEIDDENGNPVVRVLSPVELDRDRVAASDTRGTIDPLSAIADLIHRYATTGRCEAKFRVFDGARLSEVQSWTVGAATVPGSDVSPYAGPATECDFRTQEIAGFLHDANYERSHAPQGGQVWLAPVGPGGTTVPIRAHFSTLEHGEITLFLTAAATPPSNR